LSLVITHLGGKHVSLRRNLDTNTSTRMFYRSAVFYTGPSRVPHRKILRSNHYPRNERSVMSVLIFQLNVVPRATRGSVVSVLSFSLSGWQRGCLLYWGCLVTLERGRELIVSLLSLRVVTGGYVHCASWWAKHGIVRAGRSPQEVYFASKQHYFQAAVPLLGHPDFACQRSNWLPSSSSRTSCIPNLILYCWVLIVLLWSLSGMGHVNRILRFW